MRIDKLASLALLSGLLPALAGCGGATQPVRSASAAAPPPIPQRMHSRLPQVRQPAHEPPPPVHRLAAPGLEGVIGAGQTELTRQFGPARLEVWEGDARKLQFTGPACVLDVYLYPEANGREPRASYVDARRASDGKDVDRAACIAALRPRGANPAAPMLANPPLPGR